MWSRPLLILPEHPSFWAIKKLCSFSWTFPENSRRPGGFYFYMMFMIPEFLVNFAMRNLLKMFWQRRSKSIKSINSFILKRQKSLRWKAILGRDEKLKYFDGSFKWVSHLFSSVFSAFGLCAWRMVLLGMILTTFPLELSVYVCVGIIEQSM
jgi:hypothetical protein